jgi:hypothetical protein
MNARMGFAKRSVLAAGAVAFTLAAGCGPTYIEVRPSEPLAAVTGRVRADVLRLWLTDEVVDRGLGDDIDLVVELRVRNDDARERKISPGSFSCLLELDPRLPAQTLSLLAGGGAEGPFRGEPPGEGSLLLPVTIPPGQSRDLWVIFHGYRFEGSDRPRRVTLKAPLDDGMLVVDLADPARGALRWQAPAQRTAISVGIHNVSLFAGGLNVTAPGWEATFNWRRGPVMWDVGLLSSVLVQTQGPLQSVTSTLTGVGLTAHLTVPLASWGAATNPRMISVFAGGSASFLVELLTPARAKEINMNMNSTNDPNLKVHTYGFPTVEAGLELDFGQLRFAASPFPLSPSLPALPRWSARVGYVQGWAGGSTGGGILSSFRFMF